MASSKRCALFQSIETQSLLPLPYTATHSLSSVMFVPKNEFIMQSKDISCYGYKYHTTKPIMPMQRCTIHILLLQSLPQRLGACLYRELHIGSEMRPCTAQRQPRMQSRHRGGPLKCIIMWKEEIKMTKQPYKIHYIQISLPTNDNSIYHHVLIWRLGMEIRCYTNQYEFCFFFLQQFQSLCPIQFP